MMQISSGLDLHHAHLGLDAHAAMLRHDQHLAIGVEEILVHHVLVEDIDMGAMPPASARRPPS
jgi:hypothetical protein